MKRLIASCPKSYLLGFYYGDGSCGTHKKGTRSGRTYLTEDNHSFVFVCNPDDKERVHENAKYLGVALKWRDCPLRRNDTIQVSMATWPTEFRDLIGLNPLKGKSKRDRTLNDLPDWIELKSFISGYWDADGHVGLIYRDTVRKDGSIRRDVAKRLIIKVGSASLRKELEDLFRSLGMNPYLDKRALRINSKDYSRFKEVVLLMPKKQKLLELF